MPPASPNPPLMGVSMVSPRFLFSAFVLSVMRPDSRISRLVREVILIVEAFVCKAAGELLIPFTLLTAGAERHLEARLVWSVRGIQDGSRDAGLCFSLWCHWNGSFHHKDI